MEKTIKYEKGMYVCSGPYVSLFWLIEKGKKKKRKTNPGMSPYARKYIRSYI